MEVKLDHRLKRIYTIIVHMDGSSLTAIIRPSGNFGWRFKQYMLFLREYNIKVGFNPLKPGLLLYSRRNSIV